MLLRLILVFSIVPLSERWLRLKAGIVMHRRRTGQTRPRALPAAASVIWHLPGMICG